MARARNIKPGFFRNADLVELPVETRMLFIGLWTLADREGRLEDRPRQIKMEIYPADQFDVDLMLGQLQDGGFIVRYEVGGRRFIEVTNFIKHQDPHYKEKASEFPPPPGKENFHKATGVTRTQRQRIMERDGFACRHCGSEDALCIDHILPVSRGGDSSDENLQVLCAACNTRKGNKIGGEEKNSRQRRVDVEASATQANRSLPSDSLIPDSLIPEVNTPPTPQEGDDGTWDIDDPTDPPCEPADIAAEQPGKRSRKAKAERTTFATWLQGVKSRGEKPITEFKALWEYADAAGLPGEFIELAWLSFSDHYLKDERARRKLYADWKGTFLNAVKGNYRKLWFWSDRDNAYRLTTVGQQFERALQAKESA